jgi:RNA polymerase sigma-70 factor (ECF subfamily)
MTAAVAAFDKSFTVVPSRCHGLLSNSPPGRGGVTAEIPTGYGADVGPQPDLLDRLRTGDEAAFVELVDAYHTHLVRFAQTFVTNRQAAEDVVQDTWIAVIRGVEQFERRSSLQTWLFRICANRARTRFGTDNRQVPIGAPGTTVSGYRFDSQGAWTEPPTPWSDVDDRLTAEVIAPLARAAMDELPELQRQVVTLRDVEGLTSKETCDILSITEANQRVLLHRARARIRTTIEADLDRGVT